MFKEHNNIIIGRVVPIPVHTLYLMHFTFRGRK